MSTDIIEIDPIRQALSDKTTVDDLLKMRDFAAATQSYLRKRHVSLKDQNRCAIETIEVDRKIGGLLIWMAEHGERDTGQGGDRKSPFHGGTVIQLPTLADLGIKKTHAHRDMIMYQYPDDMCDEFYEERQQRQKEITGGELYRIAKKYLVEAGREDINPDEDKNLPDAITLCHGDGIQMMESIPDNSIALIFTDPPYDAASIPLYGKLAECASRKLVDGGSLIAYAGHYALPQIFEIMSPYLRYWWLIAIEHGGQNARLPGKWVMVEWKPAVWFVKNGRRDNEYIADLVHSHQPTKAEHDWQQDVTEASYYIEHLTAPGELVADPFMGSGTTLLATVTLNRKAWGCDADETAVRTTEIRLAENMPGLQAAS